MKLTSAEKAIVFQAVLVGGLVTTLETTGLMHSDVARVAAFALWCLVSGAQCFMYEVDAP